MNATYQPTESNLKAQAQRLKSFLAQQGYALPHMTCLEAIAHQHGQKSWHHLRALASETNSQPAQDVQASTPSPAHTRAPAWAPRIGAFLTEQLKPHQDHLAKVASFLTSNRGEVHRFESVHPVRGDSAKSQEAVSGVRVAVDHDTTLELSLAMRYFNDFGLLTVEGSLHAAITREGVGPEDLRGLRLDMVNWGDCTTTGGCEADLAGPWQQLVSEYLANLPLSELLLDALPLPALEGPRDLQQRLSTRLEGLQETDLVFDSLAAG